MRYKIIPSGEIGKFKIKIEYNVVTNERARRNLSRETSLKKCIEEHHIDGLYVSKAFRSRKNPAKSFIYPQDIGNHSIKEHIFCKYS